MTTFVPRAPYSKEELAQLYPQELELQLVQVVSIRVLNAHGMKCFGIYITDLNAATSPWFVSATEVLLHS